LHGLIFAEDYVSCITICDPTATLLGTGLMCLFYDPDPNNLPQPVSTGEILIAYNVSIKPHGMDMQAWSCWTTHHKLVDPAGFDLSTLLDIELKLYKELKEWWTVRGGAPGAKGDIVKRDASGAIVNEDEGRDPDRKLKQVSGIQPRDFVDLVVEVCPFYLPNFLSLRVDLRW